MALIVVHFTPDNTYTGTYTLKVLKLPLNILVYSKVYNPPYSVDIVESINISTLAGYDIKIYADDCNKVVYDQIVTPNAFCGIPTLPKAISITNIGATLNWSAPINGAPSGGYYYEIYNPGNTLVASGNATGTSKVITGLTSNTVYLAKIYSNCGTDILGTPTSVTFTTLT